LQAARSTAKMAIWRNRIFLMTAKVRIYSQTYSVCQRKNEQKMERAASDSSDGQPVLR